MHFGIFDHMDRGGDDIGQQYRDRLKLIEAYDRAGFYAYHLAEHHGTPLGLAPSPSVFLSAIAQRTKNLRLGALVYTLSLYHPIRLFEEICMLDQLSGGRMELGIGKGVSPIEQGFYGVDPETSAESYIEASEIILDAFTAERINYQGKHYRFEDVPVEIRPVQRPHPPLWYGAARPETAVWAAANQVNVIANGPGEAVRAITDRYRAEWAESAHAHLPLPKLGVNRHVVVADSEQEAVELARPAYKLWFDNLLYLWRVHNRQIPLKFPDNLDDARKYGLAFVGTADQVRDGLLRTVEEAGINYLICRLAFGNLPLATSLRSVELMEREVMPAVQEREAARVSA